MNIPLGTCRLFVLPALIINYLGPCVLDQGVFWNFPHSAVYCYASKGNSVFIDQLYMPLPVVEAAAAATIIIIIIISVEGCLERLKNIENLNSKYPIDGS